MSSTVKEITIQSNCQGLKSYGFFSTLNKALKSELNDDMVQSSILWNISPYVNYVDLCLSSGRSFSMPETNIILQILIPYCTDKTEILIENSATLYGLFAFLNVYKAMQENPEANVIPANRCVQ